METNSQRLNQMKEAGAKIRGAIRRIKMRDRFAEMALQGRLASERHDSGFQPHDLLARECYAIADAMLAARKVSP